MDVNLISLPYHLDSQGAGTGAGPARLVEAGAEAIIEGAGHRIRRREAVALDGDEGSETANIFATLRSLAEMVRSARAEGSAPIVFAGDCSNSIGVMAGLGADQATGIVWLDAHGDANTPETTETGFFDGFPLATVVGWCWKSLAATVPGFVPLPADRVVHLGGRAFDPQEQLLMQDSAMTVIDSAALRSPQGNDQVDAALRELASKTSRVHVHLDLDVIDKDDGIASQYAVGGGPPVGQLDQILRGVGAYCNVNSATICAYDPAFDADGRASKVGLRLLATLGEVLTPELPFD